MAGVVPYWLRAAVPLMGQRLVVIDPGSRCLKLVVVEALFGRVRLVHRQTIDWQEEGLTQEEARHHLETVLPNVGPHGVVIVLPQHKAMAQVLELPATTSAEARKLVEAEAVKITGQAANQIMFDFVWLKPFGKCQNPAWVTLCGTSDLWEHINPFGGLLVGEDVAAAEKQVVELTTTAQGLFAASRRLQPRVANAVLVDLGAHHTVVGILANGQGVFATSFPVGSGHFTEALARLERCPLEEAEALKRARNLFVGKDARPGFHRTVEEWSGELRRSVAEWMEDNAELELSLSSLPVFLCGGGACQEGLLDFLNDQGQLEFNRLPALRGEESDWPMEPYWAAYGAALQALGRPPRAVSLLPAEMRSARLKHLVWRRLQAVNALLLAALLLLLSVGTWQQTRLLRQKTELETSTREALRTAQNIDLMSRRLEAEYEKHQPVLQRQRQTLETLQALAAVEQAHSNREFWYVLFADAASYFAGSTLPGAGTNQGSQALSVFPTNAAPARREFVAELCIPQEGEEMRRLLNAVVNDLKHNPLFSKVDSLPAERKRNWVDPKVLITNRVFGVAIEIGGGQTQPTPQTPRAPTATPPARENRRLEAPLRVRGERPAAAGAATNR
jgi:Tfp pilus assembly PilM family ATPase